MQFFAQQGLKVLMSKKSNFSNALPFFNFLSPTISSAEFSYVKYEKDELQNTNESDFRFITINFSQNYSNKGNENDFQNVETFKDLIHNAEDVLQANNTILTLQDTGIFERNYEAISRSCKIRGITGNATDKAEELDRKSVV